MNLIILQIAFVGFAVQALATRTQPIEGLTKHISDPLGKNITW
jgi:light-harvesting complex I chlorophyll a/b binding protein 5